jgi:ribose transport system substrate-binding protein
MSKPYQKGENMEKIKIDKERTWIFSPVNNIVIKVDIKGNLLEEQMIKAINETVKANINVVVGTFETTGSYRTAYVGTNNYEFGADAASLIAQKREKDGQVDLAIILSNKNNKAVPQDPYTQNMINGISSGAINIASKVYRTSDLLGAEDQIRSILNERPDIDMIFCTNAKDTVSAAHVIIERNLVGKVDIVGTGINDEIINYVKKGVIFGVLDKNGFDAGYKSVKVLFDSMGDTFTSCYFDIKTDVYTKENITSIVNP